MTKNSLTNTTDSRLSYDQEPPQPTPQIVDCPKTKNQLTNTTDSRLSYGQEPPQPTPEKVL